MNYILFHSIGGPMGQGPGPGPKKSAPPVRPCAFFGPPKQWTKMTKLWNVNFVKIHIFPISSFFKVSGKINFTIEFNAFFNVGQHRTKLIYDSFEVSIFCIHILKRYIAFMFWRLGVVLKRFFEAKSFR